MSNAARDACFPQPECVPSSSRATIPGERTAGPWVSHDNEGVPKIPLVPARRTPPSSLHRECIVVGAGILGLSTAWALSCRGCDVLVLEADETGHARSGSKGSARIFRLSYPDPLYVRMALEALKLWRSLEAESGESLLQVTGQLSFGEGLDTLADAMGRAGAPYLELSPSEARGRFPHLSTGGPALFEECSGVLVADACLRALTGLAQFEVRPRCPVGMVEDRHDHATVVLSSGESLSADIVVNCAGPAAMAIMDGVRVRILAQPSLQQVIYLEPRRPGESAPIFIEWGDDMIYGLPVVGSELFKLSHHTPGPVVQTDDDELADDPELLELLSRAAARLLPDYTPVPVATERCIYDNTTDSDFVIDRVGHVVIGCGTSGHGFKFGPLLGELMADLALGAAPSFDLHRFSHNRSILRLLPDL
jgi:sarcosine oxidase